jgi:sortase B
MFNNITKFKEKDMFDKGIIKITKNSNEYTYKIFSVFIMNGEEESLKNKFASDEEYNKYIEYLKMKSAYNKSIDNTNFKSILTMYTCSYEFEGARTIVCAGLVDR